MSGSKCRFNLGMMLNVDCRNTWKIMRTWKGGSTVQWQHYYNPGSIETALFREVKIELLTESATKDVSSYFINFIIQFSTIQTTIGRHWWIQLGYPLVCLLTIVIQHRFGHEIDNIAAGASAAAATKIVLTWSRRTVRSQQQQQQSRRQLLLISSSDLIDPGQQLNLPTRTKNRRLYCGSKPDSLMCLSRTTNCVLDWNNWTLKALKY